MGWWFGRILTFEVEADDGEPSVGTILADTTAGLVGTADQRTCAGYAAYGATRQSAVEPILNCFGIDLSDGGDRLDAALGIFAGEVGEAHLGCSSSSARLSPIERSVAATEEGASAITVGYYDPSRDYQAGQARASDGSGGRTEVHIDAPVVLEASAAKSIANELLSRSWTRREKLTVRLAPAWLGLRPGETIAVPDTPGLWQVSRCSIDSLTIVAELCAASAPSTMLQADAGQALNSLDEIIPPTQAALFDLPSIGPSSDQPQIMLAASSTASEWKPVSFEIQAAGSRFPIFSAPRRSVLGTAVDALVPGEPFLLDLAGAVEVELFAAEAWLTSCDDEALATGLNYAALGDEVIQFGSAEALGERRFRLTRLLRGCRGTEWASSAHRAGEPFVLLASGTLRTVDLSSAAVGSDVSALPTGVADGGASAVHRPFSGEGLRPPSPVHLSVAKDTVGGLEIRWVRRSRDGWAWLDGIDVALGEERELYRVSIVGSSSTLEIESPVAHLGVPMAALAPLGSGTASVQVRQVGNHARSHPATAEIILP